MRASRERFTERLAGHEAALRAVSGDVLYNVQVHLICDVLDTIDQVADEQTAARVADALARRWADAPARISEAQEAAYACALVLPDLTQLQAERRRG